MALFTTFGMQKADRSQFAGSVSKQGDMQKGSFHRSLVMRKPAFCICENKGADSNDKLVRYSFFVIRHSFFRS